MSTVCVTTCSISSTRDQQIEFHKGMHIIVARGSPDEGSTASLRFRTMRRSSTSSSARLRAPLEEVAVADRPELQILGPRVYRKCCPSMTSISNLSWQSPAHERSRSADGKISRVVLVSAVPPFGGGRCLPLANNGMTDLGRSHLAEAVSINWYDLRGRVQPQVSSFPVFERAKRRQRQPGAARRPPPCRVGSGTRLGPLFRFPPSAPAR
jgi:hypothetical protein